MVTEVTAEVRYDEQGYPYLAYVLIELTIKGEDMSDIEVPNRYVQLMWTDDEGFVHTTKGYERALQDHINNLTELGWKFTKVILEDDNLESLMRMNDR